MRARTIRRASATPTGRASACCRRRAPIPSARLIVFTGRTGRWKGIFAVHSWVVFKSEGAANWSRYDVVGWGQPLRNNGWAPDGRWFGDIPRVIVDVRGAEATASSRGSRTAIVAYGYGITATIASGPDRTAIPSLPACCARCRSSRPRCLPTRSARTFAPPPTLARPTAAPGSKPRYGVCSA